MKTRAITAFFFTIVMLGSVFLGTYVFTVFYLILSLLSLFEFYKLIKNSGIRPHRNIGLGAGALIFLMAAGLHYLKYDVKYLFALYSFNFFRFFITELYKKKQNSFRQHILHLCGFCFM